jgi:hypothetical protein
MLVVWFPYERCSYCDGSAVVAACSSMRSRSSCVGCDVTDEFGIQRMCSRILYCNRENIRSLCNRDITKP